MSGYNSRHERDVVLAYINSCTSTEYGWYIKENPKKGLCEGFIICAVRDCHDDTNVYAIAMEDAWNEESLYGAAKRAMDFLKEHAPLTYVKATHAAHDNPL